jgi:hypothetical protein
MTSTKVRRARALMKAACAHGVARVQHPILVPAQIITKREEIVQRVRCERKYVCSNAARCSSVPRRSSSARPLSLSPHPFASSAERTCAPSASGAYPFQVRELLATNFA